jgi:hypothetical protein
LAILTVSSDFPRISSRRFTVLHDHELGTEISSLCATKEAALDYLAAWARALSSRNTGPTAVGAAGSLHHSGEE